MSRYGKVIEENPGIFGYRGEENNIYTKFTSYFENPSLTKTSEQGISSVYVAKVNSGLMLDNKYLIIIVNGDVSSVGTVRKLSDLKWVSLQTRTVRDLKSLGLEKEFKLNGFAYSPKRESPFTDKILLSGRLEGSSVYKHENLKELTITLLNSEKMQYEYPQQGTLSAALETYRTVIVLI